MTSNGLGSLVLLDSTSVNSGTTIKFHDSSNDGGNRNSQILIENLTHDNGNPIAEDSKGNVKLANTSHVDTWVWGNVTPGQYETGTSFNTNRPNVLLSGGKFFMKAQPTYAEYASDQIVNVKAVAGHTVKGDGYTDDSASLNAILADNAANCKISYFPYGVYIVKDTLIIPPGSRIVGEAWSVISGAGNAFKDARNPKAVVRVGNPGDVGVAEIQDMRFSVSEVLPGAKILEVNMAGSAPGDVGLWNTIVTVGGTAETSISTGCTNQDTSQCMAAYMVMHLTKSSSAYIENFWGWTADHNLDGGSGYTVISTGRGVLVESTKGTWLTGTGSEHHWLTITISTTRRMSMRVYFRPKVRTCRAAVRLRRRPRPGPRTLLLAIQTSPGVPAATRSAAQRWRPTSTAARTCSCIIPRRGRSLMASGTETTGPNAVETARAT